MTTNLFSPSDIRAAISAVDDSASTHSLQVRVLMDCVSALAQFVQNLHYEIEGVRKKLK